MKSTKSYLWKENLIMLKSYEKLTCFIAFFDCLLIGYAIWMMIYHCVLFDFLAFAVFEYLVILIVRIAEINLFPQWKNLRWKVSWLAVAETLGFIALSTAFMPTGTFKYVYIVVEGIFVFLCMAGPIQRAFYAAKYHLDRFASVEELTASCAEARNRIRGNS